MSLNIPIMDTELYRMVFLLKQLINKLYTNSKSPEIFIKLNHTLANSSQLKIYIVFNNMLKYTICRHIRLRL